MITPYTYTKTPVAIDRLTDDVQRSAITIALDHVTAYGDDVTLFFKAPLSEAEEALLATIVAAHTGTPLAPAPAPVTVSAIAETAPFATPSYRTKWDAAEGTVACAAGAVATIDNVLVEERYVYGGELIVQGAELGDWIESAIVDVSGLIPEGYRASLCEAWPVVAQYIVKRYVRPDAPTSTITIDTRPLCARITPGLALRVVYHAAAGGGTRQVVVNYFGAKKL